MAGTLTRRSAVLAGLTLASVRPALAQRMEIQWWHAMSGVLGERLDELVKKFNESQDRYTVVAVNKGGYDEVTNGVIAAYRARRPPHMVQIAERGYMTMLLSGAVVPVQDLMEEKGHKIDWSDFIKPVASFYTHANKLTTLPFNSSTPIFWYNKDHFQKAGFDKPAATWQELERQLYVIKRQGISATGTVLPGDFPWSLLENYSAINDQPYGTRANGFDGLDTEFVYNTTKVVPQVARLKRWLDDGVLEIAGQGLSPEQLFTSGRASTFVNSTASHGNIERNARIAWSATTLPHEEGSQPRNSTIGGGAIWVLKGHRPEQYDGVAAFLAFVASPETQVWWHGVTGYVPATNKAYELAKARRYYADHPTREIAILQLSRGTPNDNSRGFRFGNFVQTMLAQKQEVEAVFTGQKQPQQAMDDAVKRGNEILRQFEKLNAGRY
jgi:sn-glycerol 3-phosphate transport system substrate-binding protein